jgi:hypothetical protein
MAKRHLHPTVVRENPERGRHSSDGDHAAGQEIEPWRRPVTGVRLPRGLSSGFAEKAMAAGCGIPGLDGAMRGLLAARDAILKAIVAINTDMKSLERSSSACRRLMTIPGVGRLTALAFAAAIDDPDRFRRSRDVGAYLGLVPRRYQSGEIDYTGSISKCGTAPHTTLRGGQCYAHPLPRQSCTKNMGVRHTAEEAEKKKVRSESRPYCRRRVRHRPCHDQTPEKLRP